MPASNSCTSRGLRIFAKLAHAAAQAAIVVLVMAAVTPALAQSTWTGAVSNDWTDSRNWTGITGVPTAGVTANVNTITPNPTVLGVNGAVGILNVGAGGGTGHLTIQNGSTLSVGAPFISNDGVGTIEVTSGSKLITANSFQLGVTATSVGTVTVTGANSHWTSNTAQIGLSGTGTLNITDNGTMTVTVMQIGTGVTASGTLNVTTGGTLEAWRIETASGSRQATFDGGTLRALRDSVTFITGFSGTEFNIAAGGMTLDTNGFNVSASAVLSGSGALTATGAGTLTLDGANTFQGGLTVNGATVVAGSATAFGPGLLTVNAGTADLNNNSMTLAGLAGAGGTVSLGSATLTLNQASDTAYAGVIIGSGSLVKAGSGTLTLTGTNIYTGGTTIADGTLQLGNGGAIGSILGNVDLTSTTATLAFNRSDTYTFDGDISGSGQVIQKGTGTTVFGAGHTFTYTGPTTIEAGTLLVNGSITSNTTVQANGTLGGTGTVTGDVDNFGTVTPGTPGDGAASLGQKLTIAGNYNGETGSKLNIYTELGDDSSPTSQLVISGPGHTTSGMTGVVVTNVNNSPGAQTTGAGIPVIITEGGATTGADTFLGGGKAGPFQYVLFHGPGSAPGDADTWYLRTHSDSGTGGPLLPPGVPVPLYRPEVSIYSVMAGLARQQELTTLGTFHDRNGDQRLAGGAGNRTAAWGRLFGQHMEQSHWGHAGASFDGNTGGLQSGLDVAQWVNASGHQDRFGLFAAYARTTGDVRGFSLGVVNAVSGRAELDGTSVGAYWTHLAPSGWYTDTVLMGTRFSGQGSSMGDEVNISGYGVVASIEGGYQINLWGGLRLEPQAQLVYQHINLNDVDDPFAHVAYDTPDALFGRIGLRLSADMLPLPYVLRPYLQANIWQDFTETDTIRFSNVHEIWSRHEATTLELGGGIVAQLSPGVGLWASAEYTTDIGGSDESRESVRGTAGLRVVW